MLAAMPAARTVTELARVQAGRNETKTPRAVFDFLDRYFGTMVQIVKGHDGVVNNFLGDGLLAFWGAPNDEEARHPSLALAGGAAQGTR